MGELTDMKKKSIIFFILTLCCIICLSCILTGCSSNNVEFVKQSFKVDSIDYYDILNRISVTVKFDIKSSVTCEFNVKYVIAVKNTSTGKIAFTKELKENGAIDDGTTKTLTKYVSFDISDYSSIQSLMDNATIELQSIDVGNASSNGISEEYDAYAIGFGVTAALLCVALLVFFVMDKLCN